MLDMDGNYSTSEVNESDELKVDNNYSLGLELLVNRNENFRYGVGLGACPRIELRMERKNNLL